METLIERMSWPQVRSAIDAGYTRVILVVGAMEQHGPHMAIGTDTFIGYEMARRLSRRLGNTLVAPAITLGYSQGHLSHAGSVSISPETLKSIIAEVCASLAVHGFKEIFLLPSHGGNYRPLAEVLPTLRAELTGVTITYPELDLDRRIAEQSKSYLDRGLDPSRIGVHAGQGETSMMLAIHPDLVDMRKAVEGFTGDASVRWREEVPPPMSTMSPTGILGDARNSTPELGEDLIEEKLNEFVEAVNSSGM